MPNDSLYSTRFVPVEIKVVDRLPRTPSMKVSEPDVKALFATAATTA